MKVGIDCSSKAIHVAILDDNKKLKKLFKCESKAALSDERFLEIVPAFKKKMKRSIKIINKAMVEKELYIQNPATTVAIAKVVAGVQLTLSEFKIPFELITVTSWKKKTIKDPWAKKEQVQAFAIKTFGKKKDFKDQNFCDAATIGLSGFDERVKV